jgi:hypothetical protein
VKTIDLEALRQFSLDAGKAYGSGKITLARDADGRRRFEIENDQFRLTDEFDGGNPFCGIERIIRKSDNAAVWNHYYHGWLTERAGAHQIAPEVIFNFLRRALQQPDANTVARGPATFEDAEERLSYVNRGGLGDIDLFYGEELIMYDGDPEPVYRCRYGGGLVNLSEDTGEA